MNLLDKAWQQRYWRVRHVEFLIVLALFICFFIWHTPLPDTIRERLLWIAKLLVGGVEIMVYLFVFLSLKYNFFRWWQTARLLGVSPLDHLRTMRRLSSKRMHKYGVPWPKFCVVAVVLAGLLFLTDARLLLAILIVVVEQQLVEPLRRILPPTVLFLTASASETVTLHAKISFTIRRLRAVALLKMAPSCTDLSRVFARADCFRTETGAEWEGVVADFLRISPLVVLDVRSVTEPVIVEAKRALVPDVAYKLILLAGESGERPLLEHADLRQCSLALRQIPVVREAGLLTMLRFLTRSHDRLPSLTRPIASIIKDSGKWTTIRREDWSRRS